MALGVLARSPAAAESYRRTAAAYSPPAVTLVDQRGRARSLDALLAGPEPVALQFFFASCAGICPTLSALLVELGRLAPETRLISITIDPDADTPARLAEYHRQLYGPESWTLLTGELADVLAVARSFDAYRGDKVRHEALTFLRPAGIAGWLRVDGFPSAEELAVELAGGREKAEAAGGRIYRQGIRGDGLPLAATGAGGATLSGRAAACATCHRASGFGGVEGGAYVPPIASTQLFARRETRRNEVFRELLQESLSPSSLARLRDRSERPPYTAASLADALERGHDSAGRPLDPLMPRYHLAGADALSLVAYLRQLGAAPSPGVDRTTLHFATVLAGEIDREREDALLAVIAAYFRQKNADTARHRERPPDRLGNEDYIPAADREWQLHVWRLGPRPERWGAELAAVERARPVFALLGGLGEGSWQGVHDFCEHRRIPCLLPEIASAPAEPGHFSVYFSEGTALETRARARVRTMSPEGAPAPETALVSCKAVGSPPAPQSFRTLQWLRARGLAAGRHGELQLNLHYTLSLAEAAVGGLRGRFDRELFLETVEREAERVPNPGVYPRLSLGPGQRFASRTCRLLAPDATSPGGYRAISHWFVP